MEEAPREALLRRFRAAGAAILQSCLVRRPLSLTPAATPGLPESEYNLHRFSKFETEEPYRAAPLCAPRSLSRLTLLTYSIDKYYAKIPTFETTFIAVSVEVCWALRIPADSDPRRRRPSLRVTGRTTASSSPIQRRNRSRLWLACVAPHLTSG